MSKVRFPAEWEYESTILLAIPSAESDWEYMLDEAHEQYSRIVKGFADHGQPMAILSSPSCDDFIKKIPPTADAFRLCAVYNDTWTRDYGPLMVEIDEESTLLDFGFNGWGLKFAANHDNLVNKNIGEAFFKPDILLNYRDYVLEGGSVESDGQGTLLTTTRCLCSPNRNGELDKGTVEKILRERLGISHVLWLDHGALPGDDTDSHIDTLARICPDRTILYVDAGDPADPRHEELAMMFDELKALRTAAGDPFRLIALPLPDHVYDPKDGHELPATYANYLVTPSHVYLPTYSQPDNDRKAAEAVAQAFPRHKIVAIECRSLLRQHGSLHCSTMQIPNQCINRNQR